MSGFPVHKMMPLRAKIIIKFIIRNFFMQFVDCYTVHQKLCIYWNLSTFLSNSHRIEKGGCGDGGRCWAAHQILATNGWPLTLLLAVNSSPFVCVWGGGRGKDQLVTLAGGGGTVPRAICVCVWIGLFLLWPTIELMSPAALCRSHPNVG